MANDPMQQARALLAEEMREHYPTTADRLLAPYFDGTLPYSTEAALRAIARALESRATPSESASDPIRDAVLHVALAVNAQREEVLRAFVAKYGFQPDEFVQVSQDGRWWVERRAPSESASVESPIPDQDWKLVGIERRPRKDEGGEFVSTGVRTGYFEPIPFDEFYRWETVVGYVGKSDKPPVASIVIRALPGDGKEG